METIRVSEVFTSWQGEGRNTGMPATFVRLSGCNLNCDFCDTEHEVGRSRDVNDLIREVITTATSFAISNIIITGGEPLIQNGFNRLAEVLFFKGYSVYLETNGTVYQPGVKYCNVVCSPKIGVGVDEKLDLYVQEYKYIIGFDSILDSVDGLPVGASRPGFRSLVHPSNKISVQPCDHGAEDKNQVALSRTKSTSRDYGYRLSLQVHKLIGVR